MWAFELACAVAFVIAAVSGFHLSFFGIALAFLLMPYLHVLGCDSKALRALVWLPLPLILTGVGLGGASVMGLQPVLFGFGFHF